MISFGTPYVATMVSFVRGPCSADNSMYHVNLNTDAPLGYVTSTGAAGIYANGGNPSSTAKMSPWRWYCFWERFDGSGAVQAGFFPAGSTFSTAAQRCATTWTTSGPAWDFVMVGGDFFGGQAHAGRIAHFRMYHRWLTDAELAREGRSMEPASGGPRLWAPFTVGTTLRDRIIPGTNWTLTNSPGFEADDPPLSIFEGPAAVPFKAAGAAPPAVGPGEIWPVVTL